MTAEQNNNLILDELDEKLDAFQALRKTDSGAADQLLSDIGANDEVDRQIILELASRRPLGHPEKFPQAHSGLMRAMEVLDRNGAADIRPKAPKLLAAIAKPIVQMVTRYIVRSYLKKTIDQTHTLYMRRESSTMKGDPARAMLTRARCQTERLTQSYKRNPLSLPTFLLGGAFLSSIGGALEATLRTASTSTALKVLITALLFGVMTALAWILLQGSAIARRRIKLTMDRPIDALWQTVGRCGKPPRDQAKQFALISIVLTAIAWLTIPVGGLLSVMF